MASLVTRPVQEWRREAGGTSYLITTSSERIDFEFVNEAFATEEMFWAKRLPLEDLETMISNSLTLSVYAVSPKSPSASTVSSPSSPRTPSPSLEDKEDLEQIGLSRFATDFVTFAYLSDVYIKPEHRGRGLSTWLIECCHEVIESFPHLRRALLFATPGAKAEFYKKKLGMSDIAEDKDHIVCMTRQFYGPE